MARLRSAFATILSFIAAPILSIKLLSTIRHNRKLESEEPKWITVHSRKETLGVCTIHLLPVTATAILLFLNINEIYFEPIGAYGQKNSLAALQFAAKTHEVSITLSLSAIILDYVRYELLRGAGVPFGSLVAAFQVTNLGFLWSPGIWATAFAPGSGAHRHFLVAAIVLAIMLSATVGPASAILMVPSIGFWKHSVAKSDNTLYSNLTNLIFFIGAAKSDLWPARLDEMSYNECQGSYPPIPNNPMPEGCPLSGFATLMDVVTPDWFPYGQWNFSTPSGDASGARLRYIEGGFTRVGVEDPNVEGRTLYVAETTSLSADSLLDGISQMFTFQEAQDEKWSLALSTGKVQGPIVYTACDVSQFYWGDGGKMYEWSPDPDPGGNQDPPGFALVDDDAEQKLLNLTFGTQDWSLDATTFLSNWSSTVSSTTLWVEPPRGTDAPSIGVAYGFSFPTPQLTGAVISCSIFAGWQPIDMYINTVGDNFIHSPTVDAAMSSFQDPSYIFRRERVAMQTVGIDVDWANAALPPNITAGELVRKLFSSGFSNDAQSLAPFGTSFSIFFADVMSRLGYKDLQLVGQNVPGSFGPFKYNSSFDYGEPEPAKPVQPNTLYAIDGKHALSDASYIYTADNLTEFRVTAFRYGYGYSMQGISLYQVSKYIDDNNITVHRPKIIISAAENLMDYMRYQIEKSFGVKVYDFYGSREVTFLAGECESGLLYLQEPFTMLNDNNEPVNEGKEGRVIVTTLFNYSL